MMAIAPAARWPSRFLPKPIIDRALMAIIRRDSEQEALRVAIQVHVEEEEKELFPRADQLLSKSQERELDDLFKQLKESRKRELRDAFV